MAVHNAGSHPVNISAQKNITAERTLNCFPCLSLWDSILLFEGRAFGDTQLPSQPSQQW